MAHIAKVETPGGQTRYDVRWRTQTGGHRQRRFKTKREAIAWHRAVQSQAIETIDGLPLHLRLAIKNLIAELMVYDWGRVPDLSDELEA